MKNKNGKRPMNKRIEALVEEMLDGSILLDEAAREFERIFISKAIERNGGHISKTASRIGIHRNTLAKRISEYKN